MAQIGVFRVFADHTHKNKRNTNASTIFAHLQHFTRVFSRSDHSWCRWHAHLTNYGYFDYGKNPKTPNLSPMPESRWRRFWDLPCISMVLSLQKFLGVKPCESLLLWGTVVLLMAWGETNCMFQFCCTINDATYWDAPYAATVGKSTRVLARQILVSGEIYVKC